MKRTIVLYTEGLSFNGETLEKESLGGAETAFICVARELAALGYEVTAFCPCPVPGLFDGVDYRDISAFPAWRGQGYCDLFICSRRFEIFAEPISAAMKILWCHDQFGPEQFRHLESILPYIDEVYCLSDFHWNHFASHLPHWIPRIKKAHNGLDLELLEQAVKGIPKSHKIMYTSRPERGLPRALDLYEKLGDKTLELVVCTYDYPWKNEIIEEVERASRKKIEELRSQGFPIKTGMFTKRELYRHLAGSKAVIYPAEIPEITPISALEAQACRAVYLAPDHSGFKEVVPYERPRLDDAERWLAMLREVLHHDAERERLAEMGWRHIQPFTWANVARVFAAIVASHDAQIISVHTAKPIAEIITDGVYPKISCVLPTRDRVILVKEAIRNYMEQTWPNKELVIVAAGSARGRRAVMDFVAGLGRNDMNFIETSVDNPTLGHMRNAGADAATGDIICRWDDDDLCHPYRLEIQAAAMLENRASACFLTGHLQFFVHTGELYWVDWTKGGQLRGKPAQFTTSLMMVKDERFRYPEQGEGSMEGDDCAMQDAIEGYMRIVNLVNQEFLYVYHYHARNMLPEAHHRKLSLYAAPAERIHHNLPQLLEALTAYRLPKPISIKAVGGDMVMSYNG